MWRRRSGRSSAASASTAIAGPSEVVVLADAANDPRHVALDLLAQAEHDESAQSILITDDAALRRCGRGGGGGRAARPAPRAPSPARAGGGMARSSWCGTGRRRAALVDRLAPEHLQIMVRRPRRALRPRAPRRRRLPRPLVPGSARRLRRRPQPCAAHRPHRALRLRPVGLRLPQAHHLGGGRPRPGSRPSAPPPSRSPRPRGWARMRRERRPAAAAPAAAIR